MIVDYIYVHLAKNYGARQYSESMMCWSILSPPTPRPSQTPPPLPGHTPLYIFFKIICFLIKIHMILDTPSSPPGHTTLKIYFFKLYIFVILMFFWEKNWAAYIWPGPILAKYCKMNSSCVIYLNPYLNFPQNRPMLYLNSP